MISINNTNALDYERQIDNTLSASVAFSFNSGTSALTVTDNTTYASGDSRKAANITVADRFGKKKEYQIDDDPNNVVINLATDGFNRTEGIDLLVTVVSAKRKIKDGSVTDVTTFKQSGNFNMEK